jgi:uncharacterized membrane protein YcfT
VTGLPVPTRIGWIDAGRGLAILLVALYHSVNWLISAGFDLAPWVEVNEVLSSLRMPLFFALAGLFAPKWLSVPWAQLWNSKLRLYVWVFLLWEVIGSLVFMVGTGMQGQGFGVRQSLLALLVSPVAPRFELWFIWALTLFFLVARLTRAVPAGWQLAVAGSLSALALGGWASANVGWSGSVRYYFFFLVGVYLRPVILRLGTVGAPLAVATVLLWAGCSVGVALLDLREVPGVYFLNCVLGVTAGIGISRALGGIGRLAFLGRTTLPIYLAHTPIIILISFVLSTPMIAPVVATVAGLVPLVLAAVAVALALALHRAAAATPLRYMYEPPGKLLIVGRATAKSSGSARSGPDLG